MKAVVRSRYGSPDVLHLADVPRPDPGADEALVRIHASSVNSADVEYLKGMSLIRMAAPFRPAHQILGSDIAGVVLETGKDVTQVSIGDEVFADLTEYGFGAFAEYATVPADALAPLPVGLTFEQAAAVPSAAVIALQGLRKRQIRAGQQVLINGAGGGMGTFAVQLAKTFGAEVTGVDRADKMDLLRSIGADHVIDFETQDYAASDRRYDLILDVSAYRSVADNRSVLTPEGSYFVIGGSTPHVLRAALGGVRSRAGSQSVGIVAGRANRREDIDVISRLLEAGTIRPIVEGSYPLSETPAALRRLQDGLVQGKAVITV
jgi:NADPH:quinone reductase-like Zn-dependent oxidoreductase